MSFRIVLASAAALAVTAAGSTAFAAAPVTRSDQALLGAVFARAQRPSPQASAPAAETAGRSASTDDSARRRIEAVEAGERTRSDVTALAPSTAMHAGFRLKF